jgi:uncharacterized membrane protein (DUF2068 family)
LKPARGNRGIVVIAAFKLLSGVSLLALALGLHHFLHRDLRHMVVNWINLIRVDPENRYIAAFLAKLGLVDDRHLKELVGLVAIYAVLHLVEGTGLMLRKRWAEYLTVIATASFIPLEAYEIFRHCTPSRIALLIANLAIVAYLTWVIRQKPALEDGGLS